MKSNSIKQKQQTSGSLKDVSRFTRWVNELDARDRSLNTRVRKGKWIGTLCVLLVLFVLSFILFPSAEVKYKNLDGFQPQESPIETETVLTAPLEMPVDSFEQQLKQKINETSPQ